jgi:hypothetical protein
MAGEILRKEGNADAAQAGSEIEFALVLSRMIDSVNVDPQQLRASVYELARHKLDEQLAKEGPEQQSRIMSSLETAIQGVETHFSRLELRAMGAPDSQSRLSLPSYLRKEPAVGSVTDDIERERWRPLNTHLPDGPSRKWEFTAPWRYATVLALVAVIGLAIQQRANLAAMLKSSPGTVVSKTVSKPVQAPTEQASVSQPEPPDPLIPTTFGVYAISDGKLYTLEPLPGRAPNPRVAISPAISTPSKTVLPDRHIKFIVFRRDSTTNALNRVDVRVIAKIVRAMKFDANGKPVITKTEEDIWVIRNISYPHRTAPFKGQPDMYEVVGEDAAKPLGAGRYALILKDEAYDFSIAGEITDTKQCLESVAAANGAFYAECQKH